ncbi:methyltransferase domain-containing protein [Sphingomonas immobilis]|uniref:Class I SAM-dependent methyltransferase n=1 Tax=Sphingomonas immobilis TaxID=3063997 RepID=A0ABT9A590_9SPHN|nr:class I SAM-dependent methyltransferase [Sphingomonas sp. CA1-15]MDO7844592.1 class I SAM-dependent methyltransferase [Sphingomonas sp. CA1-15]
MPAGQKVYYLFQRYVTKSYPRPLSPTIESAEVQISHAQTIVATRSDVGTLTLLEFGAGWDLYANMVYYCYGLNHQIAIDVRRWARAETINAVIAHLQKDPPPGCIRVPEAPVSDTTLDADLERLYGIRYLAPFDGRATGLTAGSVDVVTTTSVFEHVPEPICDAIFAECRRVIAPDGMMRHTIDYSDHYAHADPSITSYNYVRFGRRTWTLLNPGIHYQNRLRTPDFIRLFEKNSFRIVACDEWTGDAQEFDRVSVHQDFAHYGSDTLRVLGAHFLLQPI